MDGDGIADGRDVEAVVPVELTTNTFPVFCVIPLFEDVIADIDELAISILGSYQVKFVVVAFPLKVLTTVVYVSVTALLLGSTPVVNALKGTPNTVPPERFVKLLSLCFICLLSE